MVDDNMKKCAIIFMCILYSCAAAHAESPRRIEKESFGVYAGGALGCHAPLSLWQSDIAATKKLHAGIIRFNSDCWDILEPSPNDYRWGRLDALTNLLAKEKMDLIFTVPISASWNTSVVPVKVEGTTIAPSHFPANDPAMIERLSFQLARHYKGIITYWEAWNEPDFYIFWKGKPDVTEYVAVIKAMYRGLKRGNPECVVVMGGLAVPFKDDYFRAFLKAGGGEWFDIANIHVYCQRTRDIMHAVDNTQRAMRDHGIEKPIWITETSTTPEYFRTNDLIKEEREKAEFLVKSFVVPFSLGVEKVFWHSLRKCGRDAGLARDFDFGLMEADYSSLPAHDAYEHLATMLIGMVPSGRIASRDDVWVYRFDSPQSTVYVGWTESPGERSVAIPIGEKAGQAGGRAISICDIYGKRIEKKLDIKEGGLGINFQASPIFVTIKKDME